MWIDIYARAGDGMAMGKILSRGWVQFVVSSTRNIKNRGDQTQHGRRRHQTNCRHPSGRVVVHARTTRSVNVLLSEVAV